MNNGEEAVPTEYVPARTTPIAPVWHTIILLVVILGLSALQGSSRLSQASREVHPNRTLTYALTIAYELVLLGYVCLSAVLQYRTPLREIIGGRWQRWRDFWIDVGIAALFWIPVMGLLLAAHFFLGFSGVEAAKSLLPQNDREAAAFIVLPVVAGFCEEIIFRGYFQRQFTAWTGSVSIGVVLQAIAFGFAHLYQGWKGVAVISVYGAFFGILAAYRKSLRPGMIQHGTQDLFSGLALWAAQKFHIPLQIIRF
jgi:uncharacterized protein